MVAPKLKLDPSHPINIDRFAHGGPRYVAEACGFSSPCWVWQGAVDHGGYGIWSIKKRSMMAHRVMFEALKAAIPDGLTLDHLCRNRLCINPEHLEPVPNGENVSRARRLASQAITHCPSGHAYVGRNVAFNRNGARRCRKCASWRGSRQYWLRKASINPATVTVAQLVAYGVTDEVALELLAGVRR